MRSLIICPVGNPITFDSRFDQENHWRFNKSFRSYETLVVQYGKFVPEDNTYDYLIQQSGQKWKLIKNILSNLDIEKYEYIGFFDDDLITDIFNINGALEIAKEKDMKLFQLSVTNDSDVFYPILRNDSRYRYTKTNFIELMGPFIHTSLIPICMRLWEKYDINTGWGFDKILCELTENAAFVLHKFQMFHPKRDSAYDKTVAFLEMDTLLNSIFPNFLAEQNKTNWRFEDTQKIIEICL